MKILINKLINSYNPKNKIKINERIDTLKSAHTKIFIREGIIRAFKRDDIYKDAKVEQKSGEESTSEAEKMDTTDMPDSESEESAAEKRNQAGKALKILTPNQMLSRLPISAQLKTGQGLKADALKTLYANLVKEQELKKQYWSENNAEKLLKDLKNLADISYYNESSKELEKYAKSLNSNI